MAEESRLAEDSGPDQEPSQAIPIPPAVWLARMVDELKEMKDAIAHMGHQMDRRNTIDEMWVQSFQSILAAIQGGFKSSLLMKVFAAIIVGRIFGISVDTVERWVGAIGIRVGPVATQEVPREDPE